ncbi:MAG: hypothetical protein FP814_13730 [Desulfobacterium sp.]|nr:hypothetical protein [Desulfobacterium sp.]MBU3947751.1 VPLPA-CTERM sorting domain-containing protein [Pseudomonadota bacterium]MBU4010706.1 VPLPA-CTERM sorting domain-containing protein [Pseudomonadota bacterium]
MKNIINGVLGVLFLLLISATAQATLSDNLLVNGDFTGTTINNVSDPLINGVWYIDKNWTVEGIGDSAYANLGNNKKAYLFQAVQLPSGLATAGEVILSMDYMSGKLSSASVTLYGKNDQPSFGRYGDVLVPITGSFSSSVSQWTNNSLNIFATSGYNWYTVVIYGVTGTGGGSFSVDNVNVQVTTTPIPTAIWLLGSGLVGMIVVRRKWKA